MNEMFWRFQSVICVERERKKREEAATSPFNLHLEIEIKVVSWLQAMNTIWTIFQTLIF